MATNILITIRTITYSTSYNNLPSHLLLKKWGLSERLLWSQCGHWDQVSSILKVSSLPSFLTGSFPLAVNHRPLWWISTGHMMLAIKRVILGFHCKKNAKVRLLGKTFLVDLLSLPGVWEIRHPWDTVHTAETQGQQKAGLWTQSLLCKSQMKSLGIMGQTY